MGMPVIKPSDTTREEAVGYILTYTLKVTNVGNTNANSVVITDPVLSGTSYVPASILSNVAISGDPTTTINLTNPLPPLATAIISYQVKINTLPVPNPIPNTASANYTYLVDPNGITFPWK